MSHLKTLLKKLNFKNIQTILNSGNIIFSSQLQKTAEIEELLEVELEKHFGFAVPTIVRRADVIMELVENNPFGNIESNDNLKCYISFLKNDVSSKIDYPWKNMDDSFTIFSRNNNHIFSVVDLSKTKTIEAMKAIENIYGKNVTTRNWNTIERISKVLEP